MDKDATDEDATDEDATNDDAYLSYPGIIYNGYSDDLDFRHGWTDRDQRYSKRSSPT